MGLKNEKKVKGGRKARKDEESEKEKEKIREGNKRGKQHNGQGFKEKRGTS